MDLRTFLSLPMSAGPGDRPVGIDELTGEPVMGTVLGARYSVRPEERRKRIAKSLAERRAIDTPQRPGMDAPEDAGTLPQVARALIEGATQGVTAPGRAARGEGVTMGDVAATAADWGVLGAPMRAPKGALRAGAARDKGIRAYHGSPHDFDEFRMDKIGTGEGAQAYGHGLYFAESEGVARSYRDSLASPFYRVADGVDVSQKYGDDVLHVFENVGGDPSELRETIDRLRQIVSRDLADFGVSKVSDLTSSYDGDLASTVIRNASRADRLEELLNSGDLLPVNTGRMYEVRINANPDDFLDWDAPLSEQPAMAAKWGYGPEDIEAYRSAVNQMDDELMRQLFGDDVAKHVELPPRPDGAPDLSQRGSELVRGPAARPHWELKDKFPGIKYRDGMSRGTEGGTRNYVVFDERLIEIVRKYGIAGAAAMLGVSTQEVQQALEQQQ